VSDTARFRTFEEAGFTRSKPSVRRLHRDVGAGRRSLQLLDRSPCAIVLARRDTCRARLRLLHPRSGRPFAPGQFGAVPSRGCHSAKVTSKPTAINGELAGVGGVTARAEPRTGGWWSEAGSRFVSTRFHAVTAFPAFCAQRPTHEIESTGSAESLRPFMKSGASQTRQCLRPAGSGR
jgi:hypothetical protein